MNNQKPGLSIKTIPSDIIMGQYQVEINPTHLRRDIYRFMNYLFEYGLQRSHRGNAIPKGPAKRLAKILSFEKEMSYVEKSDQGYWSDFISKLARDMGLVDFDIKGKYIGYSSSSPSYPDNFILPKKEAWQKYLASRSLDKEWAIWKVIEAITGHEFYSSPIWPFPFEDRFDGTGSAINAAPKMDLAKVRSSLFTLLSQLEPNLWYSVSDLVAYLKVNYPNLILDHQKRDRYTKENIYYCFFEHTVKDGKKEWKEQEIKEGSSEAFERVEGRYLTFFLEGIPFLMGLVNLAYEKDFVPTVSPPYGHLKAFAVTPKLQAVYGRDSSYNQVKITIQANHEVIVQYSGYAEAQFQFFRKYGWVIKDDQSLVFRLDKKMIADRVAEGENIKDIMAAFTNLSNFPIPQNIITEMQAWASQGEKITLYRQYSLLEIEKKRLKEIAQLDQQILDEVEKEISPHLFLIKNGESLFKYLESQGFLPQKLQHNQKAFIYSQETHSVLKSRSAVKKPKPACELAMQELTALFCDRPEILAQVAEQMKKMEITCRHFPKEKLLLVPQAFRKTLEAEAKRMAEKSGLEVKIRG